jgi:hypothetical protein
LCCAAATSSRASCTPCAFSTGTMLRLAVRLRSSVETASWVSCRGVHNFVSE